jgi:hypothetical protein
MTVMTTQPTLPGLGPDQRDPFRFTWWNTLADAPVWIEHRGRWREGVVVARGRKYVEVEIAGGNGRCRHIGKPYSELRRVT